MSFKLYPAILRFGFFLMLGLFSLQLSARHLIGGVITYKCLGNGDYEFTMKIYRDCNCTNCADFDLVAPVSIFACGSNPPCSNLSQGQQIHFINVPLGSVSEITPPDYPCLIPPDVCVQEGVYRWKLSDFGINLPVTNNSYHVTYQRCCRNETINNLSRPDDQGATYTIEITPEAQRTCNSSPVFDNFPPIVICNGAPLSLESTATDPDGDLLVYEFCSPLQGGGPILSGVSYSSCRGAAPSPPCPPPYDNVNFIMPAYSSLRPMGGDPVVSIDPNTGIISGTPNLQGQFVVGVCVTEYRNGRALSRVFRDFQFNVANCDPTVIAKMNADEVLNNGKDYVINSCGNPTVYLENQSFQQRFIKDFRWEFFIRGKDTTLTQWSPTYNFPGLGSYNGKLILNPGEECGDTANITVNIFPEVTADFSFAYDTCISGPVQFTDRSQVPSGEVIEYAWRFGDGNTSADQNPSHLYRIPGNLPVTLRVIDINECEDSQDKIIPYFPVPRLIVISPSAEEGCQPLDVFFDNLSFPIDETYDISWDFGDGNTSGDISPTHIFEEPGLYTVSVSIVSPIGCETDTIFPDLVLVEGSPVAGFDYNPKELNSFSKEVQFIDQSTNAVKWYWRFNEEATSSLQNPSYSFQDTGIQVVRQIVVHRSGCRDTVEVRLDVKPEIRYYLPNAFTPNNDSNNELFKGVGVTEGIQNFNLSIWNRWGEKIFETNDPNEGWNGNKFNTGAPAPNGVYVVLVSFNGPRGEPFSMQGTATLIR